MLASTLELVKKRERDLIHRRKASYWGSLIVFGISRGGLSRKDLVLNINYKHGWVSLLGCKNKTPPERREQRKKPSPVKFAALWQKSFSAVKLELCAGETVISDIFIQRCYLCPG